MWAPDAGAAPSHPRVNIAFPLAREASFFAIRKTAALAAVSLRGMPVRVAAQDGVNRVCGVAAEVAHKAGSGGGGGSSSSSSSSSSSTVLLRVTSKEGRPAGSERVGRAAEKVS